MILLPLLALVGVVTNVHDGDSLTIADGTRIRLAGIDSNELNGTCHTTCAILSPTDARDNLADLALGRKITCEKTGMSYRRVTAWCSVGGRDLSCEQVRIGAAVIWQKFDRGGRLLDCYPRKGRGE